MKLIFYMELLREVNRLYNKHGSGDYIGEKISQREHVVQAALLAEKHFSENACCDDLKNEVVLAALYHDVGNMLEFEYPGKYELTENLGILNHEKHGADYLKKYGANDVICELVIGHVYTKRYLISKNRDYFYELSDASKRTFEYQGGLLTPQEMIIYESNPLFPLHLKMREWDDKAKSTDPDLLKKIAEMDITKYFAKYTKY